MERSAKKILGLVSHGPRRVTATPVSEEGKHLMRYVRCLMLIAAVLVVWNARLAADQGKIQLTLQEMKNTIQSIDVETFKLKRLVATRDNSKEHAKKRAQSTNNLKQIGLALHSQVQQIQDLAAQDNSSAAARSTIVNGYAAEFYAGGRLENFEEAVKAFPLKAGAGDGESLKKLSLAAENLKKAAEALRRQLVTTLSMDAG